MTEYVKYGDEWRKEVMKNKKSVIVDMLRRVALERDGLASAQQSVQRTGLEAYSLEELTNEVFSRRYEVVEKPRR